MLRIEQRGRVDGPAVVMLHGCPTAPASMWSVGDALVDIARVTNVHLPGYSGSPALRPFDENAALAAIEDTLLAAGIDDAILVGYSGGSFRAFALATRARIRVRAIAALGALHALPPAMRESFRASAAFLRANPDQVLGVFTPAFMTPAGFAHPAHRAEVESWFHAIAFDDLAAELEGLAATPDIDLGGITCPVLCRVGDTDASTPVALSEAVRAALPRTELQIVPAMSHALVVEDIAATSSAVRDFVLRVRS